MTEWTQRKVSDLIDGLRAGVSVRSSPGVNGGPAVLKTSAIKSGRFDPSEVKTILKAELQRAKCPVAADSLIISRMNTPALVGDVGYVDEERADLYLPDRLWLAQKKRNSDTDMRWLTYHFSSEPGSRELRDLATGTSGSMKNIPKNKVLNLVIPTPSPLEQQAIADAIADADGLIESLKRLISKKQAIKQGMMQELLTGRTRLPGFSASWFSSTWGELALGISSGATPRRGVAEYWNGEIPWVTSTELKRGPVDSIPQSITTAGLRAANLRIWPAGTFLMAITGLEAAGTRGKCGLLSVAAATNQSCMAVAPGPDLDTEFLFYYYLHYGNDLAFKYVQGTKQQSYTAAIVKKLPIHLPSDVSEQQAIAQVLRDADHEIAALERCLESARNIKQGMMQELLTGRTRLPFEGESA